MKKNLAKIASVFMVLVMALVLTACGDTETEKFVKENGASFLEGFEKGLSASGIDSETKIEADGNDIIITCNLKGIDGIPEEAKENFKNSLGESTVNSFRKSVQPIKDQVPSLEKVIVRMCETDGDLLAELEVEF